MIPAPSVERSLWSVATKAEWNRGGWERLLRRAFLLLFFACPQAFSVELKDDRVVDQPVHRGHRGHRVFEDLVPF